MVTFRAGAGWPGLTARHWKDGAWRGMSGGEFVPPPSPIVRQVATRSRVSTDTTSVAATTYRTRTDRTRHTILADATALQLGYTNNSTLDPNSNAITRAAAIEHKGILYPCTFSGSARLTLAGGDHALTDPLNISVAAGDVLYVRTYTEVADLGMKIPLAEVDRLLTANGEGSTWGTTGADLTTAGSGDVPAANNSLGVFPSRIIGQTTSTIPVWAFLGDSISMGWTENGPSSGEPAGFLARAAVTAGHPWMSLGRGGDKVRNLIDAATKQTTPRLQQRVGDALKFATHVVCEYGVNDFSTALSLDLIKSLYVTFWQWAKDQGPNLPVWQTTTTPSGATEGPQRNEWNAWLRDGAPISNGVAVAPGAAGIRAGQAGHPLKGIVDVTAVVETAAGSNTWITGYNADTLHPNRTGHIAMAEVLDLAALAGS